MRYLDPLSLLLANPALPVHFPLMPSFLLNERMSDTVFLHAYFASLPCQIDLRPVPASLPSSFPAFRRRFLVDVASVAAFRAASHAVRFSLSRLLISENSPYLHCLYLRGRGHPSNTPSFSACSGLCLLHRL